MGNVETKKRPFSGQQGRDEPGVPDPCRLCPARMTGAVPRGTDARIALLWHRALCPSWPNYDAVGRPPAQWDRGLGEPVDRVTPEDSLVPVKDGGTRVRSLAAGSAPPVK